MVWRPSPRDAPISVKSIYQERMAHRVVNVGDTPLVFFVTWMSDCGHEYGPVDFPNVAKVPGVS